MIHSPVLAAMPPVIRTRARRAGLAIAAIAALLLAVNVTWVLGHLDWLRPMTAGDPAPRFDLPEIGAGGALGPARVDLAALRGQVVVLDFWATWCKPCRDALPRHDRLARERADRGLVVVAINLDDAAAARAMFDDDHRPLRGPRLVFDDGAVANRYGVGPIPHVVVIDRAGVVRAVRRGASSDLESVIDRLLAEPGGK